VREGHGEECWCSGAVMQPDYLLEILERHRPPWCCWAYLVRVHHMCGEGSPPVLLAFASPFPFLSSPLLPLQAIRSQSLVTTLFCNTRNPPSFYFKPALPPGIPVGSRSQLLASPSALFSPFTTVCVLCCVCECESTFLALYNAFRACPHSI